MAEIAWLIILARLIAPIIILRFPITGVAAVAFLDFIDFDFLGGYSFYQQLDKILDTYFLAFCTYAALKWQDVIARDIVVGTFVYRLIGVILLLFLSYEPLLLLFPSLTASFFVFYVLYTRLSRRTVLFDSVSTIGVVIVALLIPKLFQEYSLHVHLLFPDMTPEIVAEFLQLNLVILTALWLLLPAIALTWAVIKKPRPRPAGHIRNVRRQRHK